MQQIFGLLIIFPVCALLGSICLKLAKQPVNFASITIFTMIGGVIGLFTIGFWGFFFANNDGQIESGSSVIAMFLVSGIFSVIGGLYAVSVYKKRF